MPLLQFEAYRYFSKSKKFFPRPRSYKWNFNYIILYYLCRRIIRTSGLLEHFMKIQSGVLGLSGTPHKKFLPPFYFSPFVLIGNPATYNIQHTLFKKSNPGIFRFGIRKSELEFRIFPGISRSRIFDFIWPAIILIKIKPIWTLIPMF